MVLEDLHNLTYRGIHFDSVDDVRDYVFVFVDSNRECIECVFDGVIVLVSFDLFELVELLLTGPFVDKVVEAPVGFLCSSEAGELPNRLRPPPVHCRIRASPVWLPAREADVIFEVEVSDICWSIQSVDFVVRNCHEPLFSLPTFVRRFQCL